MNYREKEQRLISHYSKMGFVIGVLKTIFGN